MGAGSPPNLELNLGDDFDIYGKAGTASSSASSSNGFAHRHTNVNTNGHALAQEATLLASTLDGRLVALSTKSGETIWNLDDEPVVRSPFDNTKPLL